MTVTAIVADPFGNVLAEIVPEYGDISWILNGIGAASLTMRTNDAKWTRTNFRQGGMLLLEFDNGLQPWVGVLEGASSIEWQPNQRAKVNYISAEAILKHRLTDQDVDYGGATAGSVASNLLAFTNGKKQTGILPGELWTNSPGAGRVYHYDVMYDALVKLQEATGGDWAVTGYRGTGLNKDKVDLRLNFWARKGRDLPDVALVEDHNALLVSYVEQDSGMANSVFVVGAGNDWSTERPIGTAQDADSIAENNLFETSIVANDITESATADALASATLAARVNPYRLLTVDTTNLNPGAWAAYDVGDKVACLFPSAGWAGLDGMGRVVSRAYNPLAKICRLVVEMDNG